MHEAESQNIRIRVLVATNALEGGGAQRSNLNLATGLIELGFDVSVLTVRPAELDSVAALHPSIALIDLGELRWPRWTRGLSVLRATLRTVRREQTNVVISGSFGLNQILLAARATRVLRRPLVVIEHLGIRFRLDVLGGEQGALRRAFRWLLSLLYQRVDCIVAVSRGVADEFEAELRLPPRTVAVVHNGLDLEHIAKLAQQRPDTPFADVFDELPRPRIISVGRLERQKAQADLLQAFATFHRMHGGSLTILGEGTLREELTALVETLGLSNSVKMPGHTSPPYWYVAQSDLFVLSSIAEGHPLVLVESLACGTPVVSTDCPSGPSEILTDPTTGKLARVANPASLCAEMTEALAIRQPIEFNLTRFNHQQPAQNIAAYIYELTRPKHPMIR